MEGWTTVTLPPQNPVSPAHLGPLNPPWGPVKPLEMQESSRFQQRTTAGSLSNSSGGKPLPSADGDGLSLLLQHLLTVGSWLPAGATVPCLATSIPWQPQEQSSHQTHNAACTQNALLFFMSCMYHMPQVIMWILLILWLLNDRCQSLESHGKPRWTHCIKKNNLHLYLISALHTGKIPRNNG